MKKTTDAAFDVKSKTTVDANFAISSEISTGDLVTNHSDKKYYHITGLPNDCTFNMEYVGFWLNTKYRFQDWFEKKIKTSKLWVKSIFKVKSK